MAVIGIEVVMGMRMMRAIGVHVFVLMENDFKLTPEHVGDPA